MRDCPNFGAVPNFSKTLEAATKHFLFVYKKNQKNLRKIVKSRIFDNLKSRKVHCDMIIQFFNAQSRKKFK